MKKILVLASLCSVAAIGWAEPQRSLLTHENRFPDYREADAGALFNYSEYDARDERTLAAYGRYTILTNLTLSAKVPFKTIQPQFSNSDESGIGDVKLGLDLVAYEDIFEYPYIIPHADVTLTTGDEDKGLGRGRSITTVGVSLGTVTYECLHWIADLSLAMDGGDEVGGDHGNVMLISGALIWDLNKKASLLVEGRLTDEDTVDGSDPSFFQVGMVHKFTRNLTLGLYTGAGDGGAFTEDHATTVKADYTF